MPPSSEAEKFRAQEMLQRYSNVFSSPEGRIVLGDILTLCHFGETLNPDDPKSVHEYNVGLTILRMCGALDQIYRYLQIEVIDHGSNSQ